MLLLAFAQSTQEATTKAAGGASSLMNLMPIAVIFVIFYFLLIRPQKKAQQDHVKLLEGLAKNDEVVTSGGIFGTIVNVEKTSDIVTLRIDDNTRIKVQKASISKLKKAKTE